jgi:hypothetical protein
LCSSDLGGVESIIFVPRPMMSTIFLVHIGLGWSWKHHFCPTSDEHHFLRAHQTWVELKASFSSHTRWTLFSSWTSDVGGNESIIFLPLPMSTVFFLHIGRGWNWKHHFCPTSDEHYFLCAHQTWVELKASFLFFSKASLLWVFWGFNGFWVFLWVLWGVLGGIRSFWVFLRVVLGVSGGYKGFLGVCMGFWGF